jgi:uncharacterized protein (TIGR02246 family)
MTGPDDFPRAFATAFGAQDAPAIAAMMADDAEFLTLTGQYAEGRDEIAVALGGEFAGTLRAARLVTGKLRLRALGPGASVLSQRFILTGALDEGGQDLPRCGIVLSAVLVATVTGWKAITASLSVVSDHRM